MVLGLGQRLLRHEQDAEDAFQAAFLILLRKAGSIGKAEALGSWLYKVALRVALRLRARRRSRHEGAYVKPSRACTVARYHASAWLAAVARSRFSPLLRSTCQVAPKHVSPFVVTPPSPCSCCHTLASSAGLPSPCRYPWYSSRTC
jgi:hypothetical protein